MNNMGHTESSLVSSIFKCVSGKVCLFIDHRLIGRILTWFYSSSLNARAKLRYDRDREDVPSIRRSQISVCQYAVENSSPIIEKVGSRNLAGCPSDHRLIFISHFYRGLPYYQCRCLQGTRIMMD